MTLTLPNDLDTQLDLDVVKIYYTKAKQKNEVSRYKALKNCSSNRHTDSSKTLPSRLGER